MSIRVLQLHKRASYEYKNIQDKFSISTDKKCFALADGTTQSFNSELWAEIITNKFVQEPKFTAEELISSFKTGVHDYKNTKFEFSKNPAKASLEKAKQKKGGTATFFGLQINKENNLEIISCGDTNLFLLNSKNTIKSFPFANVDSLDANNHFINTEALLKNEIDSSFFKYTLLSYNLDDTIILATDALSRLILKSPAIINELLVITTFEQLNIFCTKYWDSKVLEEDDITALIIPIHKTDSLKIICPPKDFSFPKEKEEEFIPASLVENNKNTKQNSESAMEMNEIRTQFNGVAQDLYVVKSKLKLHEILLMVTISLIMFNLLMIYILRPKSNIPISEKNKSENISEKKYINKIEKLEAENKSLKERIKENVSLKIEKENKHPLTEITEEEAKNRQEQLIKAGYKIKEDGFWGEQTENIWKEYLLKKKQ